MRSVKALFAPSAIETSAMTTAAEGRMPRPLTGAGLGAAGGVVLGAIGGNPLLGAAAGAVAGGAVGALTSPHQLNGPSPCY